MNNVAQVARAFFHDISNPTSAELLMGMDVVTMMRLLPFGERLSKETQEHALECKINGRFLEANATSKDVTVINRNLKALETAYKLAMN